MMFCVGLIAAWMHRVAQNKGRMSAAESPPSELKSAVLFGLLYALVLVVVALARQHYGNSGLYVAAGISGLTDMDAITLSTAHLVSTKHVEVDTAWRMILVGGMANIVFKMSLVLMLGARAFIKPVLAGFGAALASGTLILILWP